MAEEKKDEKEGRKEKKEASITASIFAGEMSADRRVAVNVFVSQGGKALEGKRVDVYFGDAMTSIGGLPMISDPMGKTGAVITVQTGIKGPQQIYAKAEGMPYPTSITIEIPEEQKSQIPVVDKLDIEPTGQWYDDEGASHYQWTPRAFDESGKAVEAKIHIVGDRSFKINGLAPAAEDEKKIFDIPVTKEVKTYEVIVASPGLLEVDVFVEGVDIENEFILEGAKEKKTTSPQGGGFLKHFKWGLGIGGERNE